MAIVLALWGGVWFRRVLRLALGITIAAIFAIAFVARADLSSVKDSFDDVNVAILLGAVAFYFVNVWFQALRWHFLIRHLGSPGPLKLLPPMIIGTMGNNLLPFRLGVVLRAEYLWSRFRIHAPASLSTIVLEGWLDGVVLALVFVPALAIVGSEQGIVRAVVISGGLAAGSLLVLRLALTERWASFWRRRSSSMPRLPLPQAVGSRLAPVISSFLTGFVPVRSGYVLTHALLWTAAAWLCRAVELYLVGLAFDLGLPFGDYLVLTAALSASGIVQISPGNTGPYEFVAAEVLTGLGAARGAASAYAIVSHAVLFIPVTLVGLALFAWHRLTLAGHQRRQAGPESPALGVLDP